MIITFLISLLVLVLQIVFSWLPEVNTLPTIYGYDIDGALIQGMGQFNTVSQSVWVLGYLFQGFLFIIAYFLLKKTVIFFLGSRAGH